MRPSVIIVGAGLGGCVLADALAETWDVTMVELDGQNTGLQNRVVDLGKAAITCPHLASGLGGTTSVWHNGLIEIEADVFRERWPFPKVELEEHYARAFHMLSGTSRSDICHADELLRNDFIDCGIPSGLLRESLYYPRRRINVWRSLGLGRQVKLVRGEVTALRMARGSRRVAGVVVDLASEQVELTADEVVLACGGLGTPVLLQRLAAVSGSISLQLAGHHYEDHPSGFVAEFVSDVPLYKLWNRAVSGAGGHLRLPLIIEQDGLRISFQLRPAVQFGQRNKIVSLLSDLRNKPLDFRNYLRLSTHWDDIMDILSLRFGLQVPTQNYALLMVAEQPASDVRNISDLRDGKVGRNWDLSSAYLESLHQAIDRALDKLAPVVKDARIFPDWVSNLFSSSHHSGTARMHHSPAAGVCDKFGQVHGIENLFICDGSAIPASGSANTGLTIAALALRMAGTLRLSK